MMSRLKIGKNSSFLDLKRNTAFQLDINSPAWFGDNDPDIIPSVKAYSILVPNTAHNRRLLNRPDLLDNPDDFLEEDGWSVYFDGYLLFTGRLEVEDTQKDEDFKVTFVGGLAGNLNILKETYLSQLDYDGVRTLGEDTDDVLAHANDVAANSDDYDYVFPTVRMAKEHTYDDDGQPEQYLYANRYNGGYVRTILVESPTIYSTMIPMPKLRYVTEKILEHGGFSLAGVFDTSEYKDELRQLILFNNVTLDNLEGTVTPDDIGFNNLGLDTELDLSRHVPDVKANEFLRAVCKTFAWGLFIRPQDKVVTIKPYQDLLSGQYDEDWTAKVDPRYIRARRIEDIPERFSYEHTDDDEYATLHELRLLGRPVALEFETLQDAIDTLTGDDAGSIVYIESLNEYFELRGIDTRGGYNFPILLTVGKSLGVINEYDEPAFVADTDTLHMITSTEPFGLASSFGSGDEFLPCYYGGYVTPWYGDGPLKDIILLFYRGLQDVGSLGQQYPLASSNAYSWGEEKVGDLSLLWNGADGLYEKWWKKWHTAIKRMRPVSYPTRLTAGDLARLDFSKKKRIDKHEYLIKRVQVTLTNDSVNVARVEYMQLN